MRTLSLVVLPPMALLLVACGSSGSSKGTAQDTSKTGDPAADSGSGEKQSAGSHYDYGAKFEPAPVAEGYTRFVAPVVPDIAPGTDVTYCQYVMAPVDRDMDILDVTGEQSAGGHHTVAFSTPNVDVGKSEKCTGDEMMQTGFLGGTGGDGAAIKLPEGVAFRLPKGTGIMLNTHFINTSEETIQGESVLDLKMAEADPNRKLAGLFTLGNANFEIPAKGELKANTECVLEKDIEFFAMTNHMHEYGTSASGSIKRAGDADYSTVSDVPAWSSEMVGNPPWHRFLGDETLKLSKGDSVTVECNWRNTTDAAIAFPREMCFTIGLFFADGIENRACFNGQWMSGTPQL